MSPAAVDELRAEWAARPRSDDAAERWLDTVDDAEFEAISIRWFNGEDEKW